LSECGRSELIYTDELSEGVLRITLDRPDVLNAINWEMLSQIEETVDRISVDDSCRVVLFAGNGDRAFCAGADLKVVRELDSDGLDRWTTTGHRVLDKIRNLPQISVANIHGYCLGGGLELALSCDMRIAREDAQFGFPEITNGWIPGWGGVPLLTRAINYSQAVAMLFLGDRIGSIKANDCGLVVNVFESDDIEDSVNTIVERLANHSPAAVTYLKSALSLNNPDSVAANSSFESEILCSLLSGQANETDD